MGADDRHNTWEGGLLGKLDAGNGPAGAGIEGKVGGTKDPCGNGKKFASISGSFTGGPISIGGEFGGETDPNGPADPDHWNFEKKAEWELDIPHNGEPFEGFKPKTGLSGFFGFYVGKTF
jgi:hypothetical protein